MKRTSKTLLVLVSALCLASLFGPTQGFGQSDNTQLSGFIRDTSGAVIPAAKVIVQSEGEGFIRSAAGNEFGYYIISSLPPGLYTVTAEISGFKRHQTMHKKLDSGIAATLDIVLEIGDPNQTVIVEAPVSSIQSDTAAVGKLIEGKYINQLQLNGRNPIFLALVKPGVSGPLQGGVNFGLTDGLLNINGARSRENLITFDGAVGIRTRSGGQSIGVADVDAVQEVQVLTANYGAEYGRSSGGQIRIVTRSGTRDLHGGFYEYLRNAALDANSWLRNSSNTAGDRPCAQYPKDSHCRADPFRYNQFGFNLSGPVVLPFTGYNKDRSKLFWLWAQEWVRFRRTTNVSNTVPSLNMRQGDFSELLNPANRFFGRSRQVLDPKTRQPYTNNIVPATQLSPNGIGLLKAFPEPTPNYVGPGTANYYQEGGDWTDQRKDTLSFDYYPTEKHAIRWRAQLFHQLNYFWQTNGTDRVPYGFKRPNQTTSVTWTWTISNTLTNEFLATGSRDKVYAYVDTSKGKYRRGQYGINYPYIFPEGKEIPDRIPTVSIAGMVGLSGNNYPASSAGPIYDISNHITKIWRNHAFKAGILFERSGENDNDQLGSNQNGTFSFSDTRPGGSGLALADAALGLFSTYREVGARSYTPYRGNMLEWFVQDGWKIRPNLRLELGLRHSIIQPYYSLWRNMAVFDANSYNPKIAVTQNPVNGYVLSGDLKSRYNGVALPGDGWPEAAKGRIPIAASGEYDFLFRGLPKQYSKIHMRDFQPRLGAAWLIGNRTVIRSGVGRFFSRIGVSDYVFLGANPPFQPLANISEGSVDRPGGGTPQAIPLSVDTQDPILNNPESWVWNVTLERKLPFETTFQIAYVGRRGLHQQRSRNINQLLPGTRQANPGIHPDYLRPYKGFGPIRHITNEASSRYNGLQLEASRRFSRGIAFGASYTYSKCQDNGSQHRDILPNAYDDRNLWGPCDYDRSHVLVLYGVFELPRWRNGNVFFRQLLGGWTISFISLFQTGSPFSIVTTGDDFAGVGPGSGAEFWVINGDPKLTNDQKKWSDSNADANFWFKIRKDDGSAMFTPPPSGTFNKQSVRNFLTGPGLQSHNLSLSKDFVLGEKHRVQFRVEAFNWPNHPNWNSPTINPRSGAFGKVQSKSNERVLQLALRYSF